MAPRAPQAFPPQAAATREGDGSCRCDFGAVCPVLGLGKWSLPRRGAHPWHLPPHAKPPRPYGSRQRSLQAGTDRNPTPATASRHRLAPDGLLVQLTAGFRRTEASPSPVAAPTREGGKRRTISPSVSGGILRAEAARSLFPRPALPARPRKGFR